MYSAVLLLSTALDTLTVTLPVEIPFTVNLLSSTVAVAMFDCEPSAFKNSMSRYGSLSVTFFVTPPICNVGVSASP